jgi:perosamine synthetase
MKQIAIAEIKLTEQEIAAAVRVLRSGFLVQGKECEAFEQEFANKVGAQYAVTSANGTAALHLAYLTFLQPGDEVLVPAFTFFATASMVSMTGGKPVFCDVNPDTFLIDLADAERKITPHTKAITPVHLFGNACDIGVIQAFASKHNLIIVWDAAQAHGARYQGQDVGSFGDFVCYSFYPTKNMFVGEGGLTCTTHAEYAEKIRYLRTHGQTGRYDHTLLGFNYRITDVEAAIGREQLKRFDQMLAVRRRNAAMLHEALATLEGLTPQQLTPHSDHAWHQYCVLIDPERFGCDRDTLAQRLKEQGVATGVHYPRGLHQQPIFEELYGQQTLPVTEHLARNILALPVHHGLSEDDVHYIAQAIRKSCRL